MNIDQKDELMTVAHELISQSDIILKISKSDLWVSSKPGVSTKHKFSPGYESLTTEISLVQEFKACPAIPVIPLAISMNFGQHQYLVHPSIYERHTELFPVPVGPITLKMVLEVH